jgi:hypothetical protein
MLFENALRSQTQLLNLYVGEKHTEYNALLQELFQHIETDDNAGVQRTYGKLQQVQNELHRLAQIGSDERASLEYQQLRDGGLM